MKNTFKNAGTAAIVAAMLISTVGASSATTFSANAKNISTLNSGKTIPIYKTDIGTTIAPGLESTSGEQQKIAFLATHASAVCGGACILAALGAAAKVCARKARACKKALQEVFQKIKKIPRYAKAAKLWARNTHALVKYGKKMKRIKKSARNNEKLDNGGALGFLLRVGLNEPKDVRGYMGASYLIRNKIYFMGAAYTGRLNKANSKKGGISPISMTLTPFTPHHLITKAYNIRPDYCDKSRNKDELDQRAQCAEVQLFSRALSHVEKTPFWRNRLTSIKNGRIAMKHSFFAVFQVTKKTKRKPGQNIFKRMTACARCQPVAKDLGATDIFANPFYSAMFSVMEYIPLL